MTKEQVIELSGDGLILTSKDLINKYGTENDIEKMIKTGISQTRVIQRILYELELSKCSWVRIKKGLYSVKSQLFIEEKDFDSNMIESIIDEREFFDDKKECSHFIIRPLSKKDEKLLSTERGVRVDRYEIRRLLSGLLLNRFIKGTMDENVLGGVDAELFNGFNDVESNLYNAHGNKVSFFLRHIDALNIWNYACNFSEKSKRKRIILSERHNMSIDKINDFANMLQDFLNRNVGNVLFNMRDSGLIEYTPCIRVGKISNVSSNIVKDKKTTFMLDSITPSYVDSESIKKVNVEVGASSYRKLTKFEEVEFNRIKSIVEDTYPYAKNYYNLIRSPEAMKLRRELIFKNLGFDDCILASDIYYEHNEKSVAFMSYYDDFNEELYLSKFLNIVLNHVKTTKCVKVLTEDETFLILELCKSMLDPKSPPLFSKSEISLNNIIDLLDFDSIQINV